MADEEHLRILRQGVDTWNQWRKEHPDIQPDLRGAGLHAANLRYADLTDANLSAKVVTRTTFFGADVSEPDVGARSGEWVFFDLTDLSAADLSGADLRGADLSGAILSGTDLTRTALGWVSLDRAQLGGADLSGATIGSTGFGSVDLSVVKGLESVRHLGPSTIGIDTVYASQGRIPEVFLRRAGVPSEFITYMQSLIGRPIEFYSCFISYSSNDEDFVERLYVDLQARNVPCFFASEDMKIGDKIWDRLDRSIRLHDKLLLVLSANSIGSEWVEDEVTTAFEEERRRGKTVLLPVRVDDTVFATEESWAAKVRQRHIGDFRQWKQHDAYQKAFERLLRDLKAGEVPG